MNTEPRIERKGVHPIFKYTVRIFGFHTVFIDDDEGNLVIASDRGTFKHWWGFSGRGKVPLREFLVRANDDYISDKLSYGLSRWDGHEAKNQIWRSCEEKWGHCDNWPYQVYDCVDRIDTDWSADAFYMHLNDCPEFCEVWPPGDFPIHERYANKDVELFMRNVWPELCEYWNNELKEEKADANRVQDNPVL